jgi:hypothetical protein
MFSSTLISFSATLAGGSSSKVKSITFSSSSSFLDAASYNYLALLLDVLRSCLFMKSDTSEDLASSIAKFN